jgi:hypothetical protein
MMRCRHPAIIALLVAAAFFHSGCRRALDKPEQVANKFLTEVSRENCAVAWTYFSTASQEKIRAESAQAIRRQPYAAEVFEPENLYCKSTYARRFTSLAPGSAKLQMVKGTNATVIAQRREPPAGSASRLAPAKFDQLPAEILLVQEKGLWKIDITHPAARDLSRRAQRQRAIQREAELMNAARTTNKPPRGL